MRNAAPSTKVTTAARYVLNRRCDPIAKRHQPAGVARGQKASGLDRDADLIEQLSTGRTARSRMHEHRVGGEQRREHHDVAKQEDPEAIGDDDPLRGGTGFACDRPRLLADILFEGNE